VLLPVVELVDFFVTSNRLSLDPELAGGVYKKVLELVFDGVGLLNTDVDEGKLLEVLLPKLLPVLLIPNILVLLLVLVLLKPLLLGVVDEPKTLLLGAVLPKLNDELLAGLLVGLFDGKLLPKRPEEVLLG